MATAALAAIVLVPHDAHAQQFNSDNYLTMPHGMATFVMTHGARNSTILSSFSLAPNWEFFAGSNMYWKNDKEQETVHFSTSLYAKHMFYENRAKTGGFAVMGGVGGNPGYFKRAEVTNSFGSCSSPLVFSEGGCK